jgi:hypothetical protein
VKRSVTEAIRHGYELTKSNWQLLVIRVAAHLFGVVLFVGAAAAIIAPIIVSAGLGNFKIDRPEDNPVEVLLQILSDHWALLLFILVVITVLLIVVVAVHSFVQAGSADVYAADEFSADRFLRGGKRGWLQVFWIYNLAWLVAGVVMLIPLLPIPLFLLLSHESMVMIGVSCLLIAIWTGITIVVVLATALWTIKAIVLAMTKNLPARDALKAARAAIRAEPGPHLALGLLLYLIWGGVSSLIGMFSGVASVGHVTPLAIFTAPLQLVLTFVNAIFSAVMESLFLASFMSLE